MRTAVVGGEGDSGWRWRGAVAAGRREACCFVIYGVCHANLCTYHEESVFKRCGQRKNDRMSSFKNGIPAAPMSPSWCGGVQAAFRQMSPSRSLRM